MSSRDGKAKRADANKTVPTKQARDQATDSDIWNPELLLQPLSLTRDMSRTGEGELRTLCYHHVMQHETCDLARQLDYLRNYGEFVAADAIFDLLNGDRLSGRYFLVTFDDGYVDTVENALPVLVDKGVPALMFVISGNLIDGTRDFSPDEPGKFLDREGCLHWIGAGMTIGSHSHTHRRLSELSDDEVLSELGHSRSVLAELLGADVRHFACPWGVPEEDFRLPRDPMLAARAGYSSFFTTTRGPARTSTDLFGLPRDVIEPAWGNWQLKYFLGH